ncbi:MAG: molybdenum cofactor guanylyltransferase [Bacteroidota bacterium]|nr:molybdenum cofactor guanylyltransferase [Bacteroidota bacterium]
MTSHHGSRPYDIEGLLLIGGPSTRFLPDKMQEDLDRSPLFHHAYHVLATVCSHVWISVGPQGLPVPPPIMANTSWDLVMDEEPGLGPLGGVLSGLRVCRSRELLVVAGDLPRITVPSALKLLQVPPADVVCARDASNGRWQPLCARWNTELATKVAGYLDAGSRSVMGFLDQRSVGIVDIPSTELLNVNRPEDMPGSR